MEDQDKTSGASVFVFNGLLSDEGFQEPVDAPLKRDFPLGFNTYPAKNGLLHSFQSNGLLDDANENVFVDSRNSESANVLNRFGITDDDGVRFMHASSQKATTVPAGPIALNSDFQASQDEDLPSLSQVLRSHATPGQAFSLSDVQVSSSSITSLTSYIPAVTFDGKTVHLRKKSRMRKTQHMILQQEGIRSLLETPVYKLRELLSLTAVSDKVERSLTVTQSSSPSASGPSDGELWVNRYKPSRFTDLLGDERVHRETMAWIKEWDYCVFGKRKHGKTNRINSQDAETYEDPYHRPREKLLLLAGPPGYGKTTLAHVVACQAGYDVMEINASDARSGQVIDDRIRPALESGSAIGSKKPICLIIDEIDGATGAGENTSSFVHKLVSLTFQTGRKKDRGDKNKGAGRPLLRPLICICNDLYASSLSKLRQHARIIRFTRAADIHLTKRLRAICESEGLRTESRALTTLVGISRGDIRGCLNTLQFIKSKGQDVTEQMIQTATTGMKENDSSFSGVLGNIFAPLPKKRVKELGMNELEESRYVSRLSADIDASGSVDKIAIGCFEHYIHLRQFEATLSRHESAANWLAAFDYVSGTIKSERGYGLLGYLPYFIVPFYPLFNERGGQKVERPKLDWEYLTKTRTNEEIYQALAKGISTCSSSICMRHLASNGVMQLEFAPYINRIISPCLNPINRQVTKPQDRALLTRLVEIMVALDLNLIQDKGDDGQLFYRLEPPLDTFITYDGKRASDVPVQRYAVRQLVAAEIAAQAQGRQAGTTGEEKKKASEFFSKSQAKDEETASANPLAPGKRNADALDSIEKIPVDFFGRPLQSTTSSKKRKNSDEPNVPLSTRGFKVSYRYNEGNSAAVRKPLKVSAFL